MMFVQRYLQSRNGHLAEQDFDHILPWSVWVGFAMSYGAAILLQSVVQASLMRLKMSIPLAKAETIEATTAVTSTEAILKITRTEELEREKLKQNEN